MHILKVIICRRVTIAGDELIVMDFANYKKMLEVGIKASWQ